MWAILSKLILALAIALFVPTGLVLASQDAIPGDVTYQVKRSLENVIIGIASSHPSTAAFFKTDFSKRRFKEALALLKRGDIEASESLSEMLIQTEAAIEAIDRVPDPAVKNQLAENLSKQIDDYKSGLTAVRIIQEQSPFPSGQPTPSVPARSPLPEVEPSITPTQSPFLSQPPVASPTAPYVTYHTPTPILPITGPAVKPTTRPSITKSPEREMSPTPYRDIVPISSPVPTSQPPIPTFFPTPSPQPSQPDGCNAASLHICVDDLTGLQKRLKAKGLHPLQPAQVLPTQALGGEDGGSSKGKPRGQGRQSEDDPDRDNPTRSPRSRSD